MQIIKPSQQQTSNWSGGTTTQLYILPNDAIYANLNFLFRISTANVETASSNFTELTGYNRLLMLLDGELKITHQVSETSTLTEHLNKFEVHPFNGAWPTSAVGKVVDFNVIFKPEILANIEHVHLAANQLKEINNSADYLFVYIVKGDVIINQQNISAHSFIILNQDQIIQIEAKSGCQLLITTITL